jgi:hypothetical protein
VPRAPPEELDRLARLAEPALHDRYSELALRRSVDEYLPRRREAISPLAFSVDGRPVADLYAPLLDPELSFERIELRREGAPPPEDRWEFLRPFDALTIASEGASSVVGPDGAPTRVMARLLLREHFVPMARPPARGPVPAGRASVRPDLFTPAALARYLRTTGIVPFALAAAVYYPDERVRYELDLVEGLLLVDPRSRRLAPDRRVKRSARIGHGVDALVGRGELSLPSVRALEAVVDSQGLSSVDIAPVFGGVRELGTSALDSLVARKLVVFERSTGLYRPRLDAILSGAGPPPPREGPASVRPSPRLTSNVLELIAQAEARSTCPLCGEPVAAGERRGLLCAKCSALVGGGAAASPG